MKIMVTGRVPNYTRVDLLNFIAEHDGEPAIQVTKNLDILVVGEENAGPSKITKAHELGIPIYSYDALLEWGRTGKWNRAYQIHQTDGLQTFSKSDGTATVVEQKKINTDLKTALSRLADMDF